MVNYKARCEDCAMMKKVGSDWICTECFSQKCADVDDCPLGFETEEIEKLEEKAKSYKKENARSISQSKTEEKRTRTVKISDEKQALFAEITNFLKEKNYDYEIMKDNKLIQIRVGDKTFKLDLIQQKKK